MKNEAKYLLVPTKTEFLITDETCVEVTVILVAVFDKLKNLDEIVFITSKLKNIMCLHQSKNFTYKTLMTSFVLWKKIFFCLLQLNENEIRSPN